MRKTKILLLAGAALPMIALSAPAFAEIGRTDAPIVLAQRGPDAEGGGGGNAERRQEREERRQERQERQERRQERAQERGGAEAGGGRAERPERQERQERPRPERAERPDQGQTAGGGATDGGARAERPDRQERQERQERVRPERSERPDAAQGAGGRAEQPDRQERSRPERAEDRVRGGAAGGEGGARTERPEQNRPERMERTNQPPRDGAGGARPERDGDRGTLRDRMDGEKPAAEREGKPARDADKPARDADKPVRGGDADRGGRPDGGGSLRDRMERDGGADRQERREERREERQDRRDDAREQRQDDRQQDKIDRLKDRNERLEDRMRDEKRDARDDRDRLQGRIDKLKDERKERREGDRVIITEPGGRTIIREGGKTIIRRDETARFRFDARDVREERRGGEIRTVVTRPDGSRVITVTDENGRLIRRVREVGGREYVLINNRPQGWRDGVFLNIDVAPPQVSIPRERYIVDARSASVDDIEEAFDAEPVARPQRRYSLDEIRQSQPLRQYVRSVDLDSITFDTGSWEVRDDQINKLEKVGKAMERAVEENPKTVFMIEGHTDAVGSDDDNLSLSDRRAESVAEVLTKYFKIPAENLTTQGYGEQYLKVQTDGAEERNRRVTVRNITPLLSSEN